MPTFTPPINPSFLYDESREILVDRVEMHRGYDQVRPLNVRTRRRPVLIWRVLTETQKDEIDSFFTTLNGTNGPFEWTPLDKVPSPSGRAPTLSQVAGGSLGADTYYVVYTWYHSANGETMESARASIAKLANYYIRVSVPVFPAQAEGWRVYVSTTSGSEKIEATITDSRTWTQSAALSGSTDPPTSNTLTGPVKWVLSGPIDKRRIHVNRWTMTARFEEQFV